MKHPKKKKKAGQKRLKKRPEKKVKKKIKTRLKKKPLKKPLLSETPYLKTPIFKLVKSIEEKGQLSLKEMAEELGVNTKNAERVVGALEKHGVLAVHYSPLFLKPKITFIKELKEKFVKPKGQKIEEYDFVVNSVPATVAIYQSVEEQRPVYFLVKPWVCPYTQAFLDSLREGISSRMPVETSEVSDVKKLSRMKENFFSAAKAELKSFFEDSSAEQINLLAGLLFHSMYGMGKIELLMGDDQLEEIAINSSYTPVTVYHKKYGWMKSNVFMPEEKSIANYASQIGRRASREITNLNPILDAHLPAGDRANATLFPISSSGNTITIRRFARSPWTIIDFIGSSHTMNLEMASLLWLAIQYEMNVLIAGGTASGKTSALNALSAFIPSYHRVISIEDVREIMLPDYLHWNWVPLTTRNPNTKGLGEVTMLTLMQNSLRMRPDRIIVGEMRRRKEAEVLFEAMHTGHSVYSTLHANNSQEVLRRLIEPPMAIPSLELEAIDLLLVQHRDRKLNVRRTFEISEIDSGVGEEQLIINPVFKWQPREDNWETLNPASKFVRRLNLHTGLTEDEITKELKSRSNILQWMLEHDLKGINQVGRVMKAFYAQPDLIKKAARQNQAPQEVLGK